MGESFPEREASEQAQPLPEGRGLVPDELPPVRPGSIRTVDPQELTFSQRTAAYVCTGCGIGECLDAQRLAEVADDAGAPAKVHGPLCIPGGVDFLRRDIADQGADRAVIAACSERVNWDVFSADSLGVDLVERVNVRELVAWSKPPGEEETQALGEDYVRMGIAHSKHTARPPKRPVRVEATVLVVGGGISGITAALEAAGAGHEVMLVERGERLGGWMAGFHKSFPTSFPYDELRGIVVQERAAEAERHPLITVHTSAEVSEIEGMPGDYKVTVDHRGETTRFRSGAIVVATGWHPHEDPDRLGRLGYGRMPNVITNVTFEGMARDGRLVRPSDGRPAKRVAFVQRPGMTQEEKTFSYGANVLDLVALKQALYVKELDPEAQAYIFYEGVVSPGLYEDFYRRVQQEPGVLFTAGDVRAVTSGPDGGLAVQVENSLLGGSIDLAADVVVLACGMVPRSAEEEDGDGPLRLDYKQGPELPAGKFGFSSSNFICFPYESARTGIYAAGCVREPLDAEACVEDATGAALKAIQSLERIEAGEAVHPRARDLSLPYTRKSGCTRCGRCTAECPFSAIELDELRFPRLNPSRCRRCGICMGACPVQVISFENYSVDQLTSMVQAIEFPEDPSIPRVLALVCENDAYPAFDQAGIARMQFDAAVRVIPLRCFGSLNYAVVAEALSNGIDGVMLMGCRTGDDYQCHMIRGSELAATRMDNVRETMSRLALEPERVRSLEVEISAYHELPGMIADFVARIRELGPTEFRVYQYE